MSQKQKLILLFLLFTGTFLLALPQIRSGLKYSFGYGFWGPNGHDGIWHLSLINHIKNPLKISLPIFSGAYLQNYHPFFNITLSFFQNIFRLPSAIVLFQFFPLVSSFFIVYFSFKLGQKIGTTTTGLYLAALNIFASSLGWVVSLFRSGNFYGESIFWSMQSASTQINPPFALSLVFILSGLLILLKKNLNRLDYSSLILLSIAIPITKAYGGVIWFFIYGLFSLNLLRSHKSTLFFSLLASLLSSFFVFSLFNKSSGNLFQFQPFWFTHSMIESPDRFYLPRLASLLYNLKSQNDFKAIIVEILLLGIFILGNFGSRLLGLKSALRSKTSLLKIIFFSIIFSILIPTFFVQKGTAWNSIQFLYYGLFLSNIFLSLFLTKLSKNYISAIFITLIFLVNILGNIGTYQNYLGFPPPSHLPAGEIAALDFLKKQPSGTILTYPYDKFLKQKFTQTPIPLYVYETTSYVSAFSRHPVFLEDEMNLEILGIPWQDRRVLAEKFFLQQAEFEDRGFLVNHQIGYIYLTGYQLEKVNLDARKMGLNLIYQQDNTLIYQVEK